MKKKFVFLACFIGLSLSEMGNAGLFLNWLRARQEARMMMLLGDSQPFVPYSNPNSESQLNPQSQLPFPSPHSPQAFDTRKMLDQAAARAKAATILSPYSKARIITNSVGLALTWESNKTHLTTNIEITAQPGECFSIGQNSNSSLSLQKVGPGFPVINLQGFNFCLPDSLHRQIVRGYDLLKKSAQHWNQLQEAAKKMIDSVLAAGHARFPDLLTQTQFAPAPPAGTVPNGHAPIPPAVAPNPPSLPFSSPSNPNSQSNPAPLLPAPQAPKINPFQQGDGNASPPPPPPPGNSGSHSPNPTRPQQSGGAAGAQGQGSNQGHPPPQVLTLFQQFANRFNQAKTTWSSEDMKKVPPYTNDVTWRAYTMKCVTQSGETSQVTMLLQPGLVNMPGSSSSFSYTEGGQVAFLRPNEVLNAQTLQTVTADPTRRMLVTYHSGSGFHGIRTNEGSLYSDGQTRRQDVQIRLAGSAINPVIQVQDERNSKSYCSESQLITQTGYTPPAAPQQPQLPQQQQQQQQPQLQQPGSQQPLLPPPLSPNPGNGSSLPNGLEGWTQLPSL